MALPPGDSSGPSSSSRSARASSGSVEGSGSVLRPTESPAVSSSAAAEEDEQQRWMDQRHRGGASDRAERGGEFERDPDAVVREPAASAKRRGAGAGADHRDEQRAHRGLHVDAEEERQHRHEHDAAPESDERAEASRGERAEQDEEIDLDGVGRHRGGIGPRAARPVEGLGERAAWATKETPRHPWDAAAIDGETMSVRISASRTGSVDGHRPGRTSSARPCGRRG